MWNGCDPILKKRLFGLTNGEGDHGEGIKIECPTSSGTYLSINGVADELSLRLTRLFRSNAQRHPTK
ncbi:MAG: hypothetical protein PHR16_13735 [Methylovulum sp.]|nr:hypothetical protein [Methylovulum sp.]